MFGIFSIVGKFMFFEICCVVEFFKRYFHRHILDDIISLFLSFSSTERREVVFRTQKFIGQYCSEREGRGYRCRITSAVHCTCTHGQNFPFGILGPRNLDPRLHTRSRFSFRATAAVCPSQHLTIPSGVPFVFDEDENRENKKSLILY